MFEGAQTVGGWYIGGHRAPKVIKPASDQRLRAMAKLYVRSMQEKYLFEQGVDVHEEIRDALDFLTEEDSKKFEAILNEILTVQQGPQEE